jgi:hypothetical protein
MLDQDCLRADPAGEGLSLLLRTRRNQQDYFPRLRVVNTHRYMEYIFRGIVKSSGASKDINNPCAFCTPKLGTMAARLPISMDIKHKKYSGEYEIDRGVLYVFFEGRNKSSAVTGPNPELLARLLLIELVFQAPSWREPNTLRSSSVSHSAGSSSSST